MKRTCLQAVKIYLRVLSVVSLITAVSTILDQCGKKYQPLNQYVHYEERSDSE